MGLLLKNPHIRLFLKMPAESAPAKESVMVGSPDVPATTTSRQNMTY
jgi:hypothetical protein